jgi:hypothetical protein
MANRVWKKMSTTLTPGVVSLYGVAKLGSTGAVTSQTSRGFSIARTGAGIYTVTLEDAYLELLACFVRLRTPGAAPTGGTVFTSNNASNTVDTGGKTFTFSAVLTSTVTEVMDNALLEIEIKLRNSGVTY